MNNEISTEKFEKIRELINKLLAVTVENGATENEAIEATLKVQRLLAKYDMEYADITTTAEDIITEECETSNDLWKNGLAVIVANNFCTKAYLSGSHVVFYGYKRHCETAKETPKEVVEKYNELGLLKRKTRITYNKDKTIYNRGYNAGREVASRKEIEA